MNEYDLDFSMDLTRLVVERIVVREVIKHFDGKVSIKNLDHGLEYFNWFPNSGFGYKDNNIGYGKLLKFMESGNNKERIRSLLESEYNYMIGSVRLTAVGGIRELNDKELCAETVEFPMYMSPEDKIQLGVREFAVNKSLKNKIRVLTAPDIGVFVERKINYILPDKPDMWYD